MILNAATKPVEAKDSCKAMISKMMMNGGFHLAPKDGETDFAFRRDFHDLDDQT